ncbi:stalk domain-containing protein [Mangrovibacillus cuniculi]|uniref:Copper amine oxidase N-terminal domain-containing protein n=1 Tax=Mangrovibacillus cuniculi TaxID=2593652 RepID=A0A7S8CBU0_9BACI|nr:stalk domain-containing protein [Mangrovibacillus cuniculi]QPC47094.1 copper amine oxidase N-terminal domain-containing protein [Mangrovibacillus cuniculi]QPC48499.1 copper amine oxidase N-terminal domain-containing protein [Mangrovibacillus cuniculi]
MKKKVFAVLVILTLTFTAGVMAAPQLKLIINGTPVTSPAPKLIDGSTYVPLRVVSEMLGAEVGWDAKSYTVTVDSEKQPTDGQKVEGFHFHSIDIQDVEHGYHDVYLNVKNNTGKEVRSAYFNLVFYDKSGKVLASELISTGELKNGETKFIDLMVEDKIAGYSSYKFHKDAIYFK